MPGIRTIPYRRRREDKTNYKKRMKLLLGKQARLVVRKSLNGICVQIVAYGQKGDKVVATARGNELKKFGWKHGRANTPSAYLVGYLAGKRAVAKKQNKAIIDLGLQNPRRGTRLYAAVKGAIDAGMQIPCEESIFPKEERIKGEHIANNQHIKEGTAKEITKTFEACKQKITQG